MPDYFGREEAVKFCRNIPSLCIRSCYHRIRDISELSRVFRKWSRLACASFLCMNKAIFRSLSRKFPVESRYPENIRIWLCFGKIPFNLLRSSSPPSPFCRLCTTPSLNISFFYLFLLPLSFAFSGNDGVFNLFFCYSQPSCKPGGQYPVQLGIQHIVFFARGADAQRLEFEERNTLFRNDARIRRRLNRMLRKENFGYVHTNAKEKKSCRISFPLQYPPRRCRPQIACILFL